MESAENMLCDFQDSEFPELEPIFHNVAHRILPTNGNGKCALHARFGVVAGNGFLEVQNVRGFIDDLFVLPFERRRLYTQVYESLDADSVFFLSNLVITQIWGEYIPRFFSDDAFVEEDSATQVFS